MSNGDEEAETVDSLAERLEAVDEALAAAETESDLDAIEADLDEIESELEASELPVPDDEDEESPAEELESQLEDYREELESQRGPYAEDVIESTEAAKSTIEDGDWTEQGEGEVIEAVEAFTETVGEILDTTVDPISGLDSALDALSDSAAAVDSADLDPDDDSETLAELVDAVDTLEADLEAAQEWDDLTVRETLQSEGYYDVLGHTKDYPPEWAALKEHEKRGNTEMVLLAFDELDSDFMEEHCLDTLARMGPVAATEEAIDAMMQLANKRNKPAIKALGKMGATEAVDTLIEYVDADKDAALQKTTFRALGEIGDERAVQPIADKLLMDNDNVRPQAARALGLLGDTRAIKPLADTLKADDNENVRAQAAWALRQIGTKRALEAVVDHGSDDTFIVQTEIDKARRSLDAAVANA
ncbi:PBS lyase HEAT-like repeat-containing protein [Halohasta litchfieldiae]|jgi:3-methyladenine DNA glycosylase AlkD|uniref:PBS lyase HEAT-like repeat-containing protein n=1 Tax=Halohasta litchfieldiae TaxID=1073996 RepID=A0A1H6R9M0_9EURY|nr:HEAT repeat domain-containing protein [Halohasta litchfieldiae]ATW88522.1 PBS lyase HEAT-like repeat-containing protein [Halohasta litchfieldiae]SEI49227.1 PBS lyase HEAT-like repeat-containing protein [Halohasta litchfieldiae]